MSTFVSVKGIGSGSRIVTHRAMTHGKHYCEATLYNNIRGNIMIGMFTVVVARSVPPTGAFVKSFARLFLLFARSNLTSAGVSCDVPDRDVHLRSG